MGDTKSDERERESGVAESVRYEIQIQNPAIFFLFLFL